MPELSKRMQTGGANILLRLEEEARKRRAEGKAVYNLSAGTPDLPPDDFVMETFSREALVPENYQYAICDSPELLQAAVDWYDRRFDVKLVPEEITSVYGTQEGMAHIAFPLCDPGDLVLVPDPGYPVFRSGPLMAGAELAVTPLREENNYLVDLDAIPTSVAHRAKVMVVSYPNNPCTAAAPMEFYERLVHFAKKHNIFVIHDNAYCELALEDGPCGSFLQVPGARDVGMEFNSLSKSYNLTGMRMSFALGNRKVIEAFRAFRSQIDYGPFRASQKATIAALNGPQDILERNRSAYRSRKNVLSSGLQKAGWKVPTCAGTMFVWYPLPEGWKDDVDFTFRLLEQTGVICVPGSSFGEMGRGYVRFALVLPEEQLGAAVTAIEASDLI
ncbi:MAG: aminotransferase class I/II-fold pyridoxal phosphate-dependent enzyme [Oscillospiraceae bacterium]